MPHFVICHVITTVISTSNMESFYIVKSELTFYSSFLLELLKKTYCSFLLANYGQLEMSDVFDSLHRKYGDILKLRMGAEHAIIISHPDYRM
jgi:hypothetical protein